MSRKKHIIVVGAGLVGSLLACLLAKRGYQVSVFDRRPDPRKAGYEAGRSINLAMSHRGWTALERAGMLGQLEELAVPMQGRMMHSLQGELQFQPYGQKGQAIYSVSRALLNWALLEKATLNPAVTFHFGMRCKQVDFEHNSVLFANTSTGKTSLAQGDILIGADGAYSAVRGAMMKTDRFNFSQHYIGHGYKELSIPADTLGNFAMEPHALHIWPRKEFMLIALPNHDRSFTATLFLPFEGPVSFAQLQSEKAVADFFGEFFPDALPVMPKYLHDFHHNPTASLITVRCSPWAYRNTLLIGDAAHAIVPFYGQGMNAGFEDCTVLDQLLDAHHDQWEEVIPAFQKERIPNANAIADLAQENFIEMRDLVGDPDFLLRKKIEARLHRLFPTLWVPQYTLVTFTNTPYREAQRTGKQQKAMLDGLMAIEGIRENWETFNFEELPVFKEWLASQEV